MGRCEMRSGKGEEEESVCEAVTLSCVSVGVSHSSGPAQGGFVAPLCSPLLQLCCRRGRNSGPGDTRSWYSTGGLFTQNHKQWTSSWEGYEPFSPALSPTEGLTDPSARWGMCQRAGYPAVCLSIGFCYGARLGISAGNQRNWLLSSRELHLSGQMVWVSVLGYLEPN